jgi:hypothetical protein
LSFALILRCVPVSDFFSVVGVVQGKPLFFEFSRDSSPLPETPPVEFFWEVRKFKDVLPNAEKSA